MSPQHEPVPRGLHHHVARRASAFCVVPTRRTYSGPLAVGYDLMTISIGEKIAIEKRVVFVE